MRPIPPIPPDTKRVVFCLLIMAPHLPFWSMLLRRFWTKRLSDDSSPGVADRVQNEGLFTRYGGEFFSVQRLPSTATKAALWILFLTKPSHSVLPLNPLKKRRLSWVSGNGIVFDYCSVCGAIIV
jgi:hypothetical protein